MENVDVTRFDELIKGDKPVVCDFYAKWCAPCKMLAPIMENMSQKYSDKASFIKVDIDENFELAARYGVMSIPLVAVFDGGKEVAKSLGFIPESEMEEFLNEHI